MTVVPSDFFEFALIVDSSRIPTGAKSPHYFCSLTRRWKRRSSTVVPAFPMLCQHSRRCAGVLDGCFDVLRFRVLAIHFFLVALEADAGYAQADHGEGGQHFPVGRIRFVLPGAYDS